MVKLLVTGGLGFIGSNFIRRLFDPAPGSYQILNLDACAYGANPENLADLKDVSTYSYIQSDLTDAGVLNEIVRTADVTVHFAAETHVDRSISRPDRFVQTNIDGTFNLLEAARKAELRKFVHISTDEVYGSALSESFSESDRLDPSSPYAASKAAAEMLVRAYNRTYGLNTVVLRSTNNFGPYQSPEKFIPKTIISALSGRKVPVYGSGQQIRDWIYVTDFCNAILAAVERAPSGSVYNVSAGNEIRNTAIVQRVLEKLGKPDSLLQFVEDRPGHDFRYSLRADRIRNELGWKPTYDFTNALDATVDWYVKNERWWKPLVSDKMLSHTPWKENW